jgi:hypothetical protein
MLLRNKKVTKKMMKSLTQELYTETVLMTREEIEEQYEDVVLGWLDEAILGMAERINQLLPMMLIR